MNKILNFPMEISAGGKKYEGNNSSCTKQEKDEEKVKISFAPFLHIFAPSNVRMWSDLIKDRKDNNISIFKN